MPDRSNRHTDPPRRRFGARRGRLFTAVVGTLTLVASSATAVFATAPVSAAPAMPLAAAAAPPQAPVVLYTENFEHGVDDTPIVLTDYTGAPPINMTYTADPVWLTACNGAVLDFNAPDSAIANPPINQCGAPASTPTNYGKLRQLAWALGQFKGSATPGTNHAVAAYTAADPGAGKVQFATVDQIPLSSANGRFITFGVDTAAVNCNVSAPLYNFSLISADDTATPVGGVVNACTSTQTIDIPAVGAVPATQARVGTYTSDGSVLMTGSSLGIRMTNANGSGTGNDASFDNIQVLDATPKLDKEFSPSTIQAGQTSTLTFTVTNTSELAAKNGWSFTDNLPDGLVLASPTAAATDCPQGNVTATAGGTTVEVEGNLAAGMSSCTATVKVKAAEPGQYTNGPSNVTATGLDKPADTTLTVTEPGPPVFFGCSNLVTFDNDNSGWRAATTTNGTNVVLAPQPVGWSATEGNPGGAVKSDDLDGNWTELWTPDLAAGGYTTDYSFAVGSTLQFDYKNNTGIDVDVYMTVAGANGTSYFYNFRGQITDSTKWNHIRVPMDAAQWHTGFNNGTGPVGPAPTDTEFAAALADVDHFAFSVEGQVGPDTTLFDNFGQACDDYGDAPDSYGTTAAAGGPAHRLVDYNANAHTAPVMLGAHVSLDNDGQPGAAADGDTYDDGVTFNPALGGSTPIVLAGPVTNHLTVNASKAGFVSVWVDWNGDGDFDDAGEQTVNAHAVTAGDNDVTFDGADINSDLNSYVRVRYSTDAAAVAAPTGSAPDGEVEDYAVQVQARAYTVTKKADKTVAHPGDKVTYTVTVTNTSQADYTDANPATFSDDLSGVLDDAVYNDDAAASAGTAGYTAPTLTWSGALAAGGSVTVTYSVTVNTPDTGDKNLTNAALPTGPGGQCTDGSAPPCDANVVPVQAFTVTKKADKTVAHPGDKVTYTVTVTNTGAADYTDADPASFSDDLSGVLDDAVYNDDAAASAGTAGYTAPTLTWSGALAPNASATVTYSVTVNTPDAGDNKLTNAALPPPGTGGLCADGSAAPCDPNVVPVQAFTVTKQADKTVAHPGDVLTYTVTVTNTGQVAYTDGDPASFTDDLSAVLDDAVYNNDAVASAGTASYAEPTVSWSGALAIGASVTVTYTVTVDTPDAGDHLLTNAATPAPGIGGGCADGSAAPCDPNVVPVQSFTVAKVSDKTVITRGDKVTYTVTVTNTGQVAYTDGDPASFTDDLSAVLDDAVYNNDAVASAGTASYAEPTVSWSGALAIGASVTVTYSATVNTPDTGDNKLTNAAVPSAPGGGCADGSAAPCDPVVVPVKALDITKVADRNKVNPGDKVTYTVTVVNTGQVDYTAQDLASFTDDLSAVLDDATYNNDATASAGTVSYAAPTVSWSGELAVGATVTITYSARVNDPYTGDKKMDNTVITPAGGGGNCADASTDPRCTARVPGVQLTVAKAASSASAAPGKKITYTVTVTNSGQAEFTDQDQAWITDDLSGVLDDATYARDAKASSGEISYDAPKLTWSGALAVGASVTITYSVRVNDPDSGDRNLHNVVIVPADMSSNCAAGSTDSLCSTNTTVTVPPKPPLAYTGTNAGQQLTIAALLLGFGGLFLVVGRRRRRRTDLG